MRPTAAIFWIGFLCPVIVSGGPALAQPPSSTAGESPSESLRQRAKQALRAAWGQPREVVEATSIQLEQLAAAAPRFPRRGDQQFTAFVREAFSLARQRSQQGNDPVIENRGAVLALAIVLGHARIATFVGEVSDERTRSRVGRYTGAVPVRGRRDWTRHFFVSAGMTLCFNAPVGDSIGVLKEKLDSAKGGSGFSFADLLADRAGVRFAQAATRDRAAAEQLQQLLSGPFVIDDIFPPAGDLPEGISDAAFQTRYGGVNGVGYRRLYDLIERRLDSCRALNRVVGDP